MIFSPLSVIFTTPFIKPFKIGRIVFTYLIPILPILIMWDGIISCFRTYSVKEMNELVNLLHQADTYDWQIGKKGNRAIKILHLIGTPKS